MYINFHVHNFYTSEGHGHIHHYYNVLPEATFMFTGKQHCLQKIGMTSLLELQISTPLQNVMT